MSLFFTLQVFAVTGLGCIVRVLTDRKRVWGRFDQNEFLVLLPLYSPLFCQPKTWLVLLSKFIAWYLELIDKRITRFVFDAFVCRALFILRAAAWLHPECCLDVCSRCCVRLMIQPLFVIIFVYEYHSSSRYLYFHVQNPRQQQFGFDIVG